MPKPRSIGLLVVAVVVVCSSLRVVAADLPRTRAESSDYEQTSSHQDVLDFITALQEKGARLDLVTMAVSTEGRAIPLVVLASPPVSSPAEALRTGKPIVYVQANIHGGEVEGKEVALRLMREVTLEGQSGLLERLILLIAPIYNADGNDAWGPTAKQRREQQGPDPIGKRPNGQGLDLNRDCIKAVSPEMRGALERVYTRWNPDVVFDLHTTNGTRHHYALTYSPPLNPNTEPGVLAFARDELLPMARARLVDRFGTRTFPYGNIDSPEKPSRWVTFSPDPRFVTNYAGLRNRIGILSEATSYLPFRERAEATWNFVIVCLELLHENAARVVDLTRRADQRVTAWGLDPARAPALGVRFEPESRGTEEVLLEGIPSGGAASPNPERMVKAQVEVYDRFRATRTSKLPRAYHIPAAFPELVELLVRHGVRVERVSGASKVEGRRFRVTEMVSAPRSFQGRRLLRLEGEWESSDLTVVAGSCIVRTAQPLACLVFAILEPESLDGAAAWGLLDRSLRTKQLYPLTKIFAPLSVSTQAVAR